MTMHSGQTRYNGISQQMRDYDAMAHAQTYKDDTNNLMPIGMAYVPWQKWQKIYDPNIALKAGTIFEELNLPFLGARGNNKC